MGLRVPEPKGAFYLYLDFEPQREKLSKRGIGNSRELCERLLGDTGVALLPGSEFGQDPTILTARLAYVDFDGARALVAAQQVPTHNELDKCFLETHCANVIAGIEQLRTWLQN
jgi:aspartate aminotransferase